MRLCGQERNWEVGAFVPVIATRTLLKPSANKLARWQRIAMEAAEQSEREFVPQVLAPVAFREAITKPQLQAPGTQLFIGVTRQDAPHLGQVARATGPISIATGCEGGWTEAELAAAIAVGFAPVTLGKRILRAVTAPIAALAVLSAVLGGGRGQLDGLSKAEAATPATPTKHFPNAILPERPESQRRYYK